ncbi:MAG TPA: hypothetical protein PL051_03450 [Candidatus Saccharibacteria bacterium]|nr:hypothetical protein [Candidatus Saccharibacteria bacterium]
MAKKAAEYQNNPFFVALDGLKALFNKASSVGIFLIVLSVLSLGGNAIPAPTEPTSRSEELAQRTQFESFFNEMSVSDWVVISLIGGTILFVLILIGLVIGGIADYTASKLASNEGTTLGEAFKEVMKHVASYLWLSVLIFVKVFLWTLLFIIPGIYMAIRYSLAGTVFFKEGLRGNAAIKRSLALTKGAWLTTFASHTLWNVITFGLMDAVLSPGTNGVLYRQYATLTDANKPKPAAHVLSWLTLILPFVLVFIFILLFVSLIFALANFTGNFSEV